ncbi:MAG: VCBS domain-containing protein, partial [Pseudomonas sp.]|nr:VCBS domain-containing protein [Pseudomonas sp.]
WIAQYAPIAHDVDGSSLASFDDIAKVTADLHVKAALTDWDGDTITTVSPVALQIEFQDDGIAALADIDSVVEDTQPVATGNVITSSYAGVTPNDANTDDGVADQIGTDGFGSIAWVGAVNGDVAGQYGHLTVDAAGNYVYTLFTQGENAGGYAAVQGLDGGQSLTETFHYVVKDGDGDFSQTTLTVTIAGTNDAPTVVVDQGNPQGARDEVFESGLPGIGSNAAANSEFATGTFTLADADGVDDLQTVTITGLASTTVAITSLGGLSFAGAHGTLTILSYNSATGVASYRYELTSPTTDIAGLEQETFTILTSDGTTLSAPASLVIDIVDDAPDAVDDGPFAVVEDGAGAANTPPTSNIFGNVLGNDVPGADGLTGVVTWSAANAAEVAELGTYGALQLNADGTWSFALNNSLAATQALIAGEVKTYTLDYTITDNDGDTSPATLTIAITGTNDTPTLTVPAAGGASTLVDEAGLPARPGEPAGSNAAANSEVTTGSFSYTNGDGASTVTINGLALASGADYTGAHGTLHIDSIVGTTVNYTYTLTDNVDNDTQAPTDSFAILVADSDGNPADDASSNLVINIVDDVPDVDFAGAQTVNENGAAINGTYKFVAGADGTQSGSLTVNVDGSAIQTLTAAQLADGETIVTSAGTLVLSNPATGTWTFTPALVGATSDVNISITLTDGDNDVDTDTHTIQVVNVNSAPSGGSVSATVDDEGLKHGLAGAGANGGTDAVTNLSYATGGSLTGSGGDGALNFTFANLIGATQPVGQETVTYSYASGRLIATITAGSGRTGQILFTVDLVESTGAYTFNLIRPVLHAMGNGEDGDISLALQYRVGDADADISLFDTALGTLTVTLDDDSPINFAAQAMVIENGANAIGSGALNFYQNIGADGGSVVFTGTNGSPLLSGVTPVTSGGKIVNLYGFGTDTLTGKIDLDGNSTNGDETTVFTVKLAPNTSDQNLDNYTVQFLRALDDGSGTSVTPSNLTGTSSSTYKVANGANDQDILISAVSSPQNRVNGSSGSGSVTLGAGGGVDISNGELLRFDFASGVTLDSPNGGNNVNSGPLSHYGANGFSFTVVNSGANSKILLKIYDTPGANGQDLNFTNDSLDTITQIYKNGVLTTGVASGGGFVIDATNNDVITIFAATNYDRAEVAGQSGGVDFAIKDVGFLQSTSGHDLPLSFNLTATDADGDTSTGTLAIISSPGGTVTSGTSGDDLLVTGAFGNTLNAGAGNDTIIGGAGADTLDGSTGNDTVSYQNSSTGVTVDLSLGSVAQTSLGDAGGDKLTGFENLTGSAFADILTGDGNNILIGLGGNDTLNGGGGDDTLIGGLGQDTLTGGLGADIFKLTDTAAADIINDFNNAEGDKIDLTALFSVAAGHTLNEYVAHTGTTLQVDVDGNLNGANFVTVATSLPNTPSAITIMY